MNSDCTTSKTYCWANSLLQRPKEKEFEHIGAGFQQVATQSSDFIINPDWVSEGMNHPPPFTGRRYRPWPYEFQGARYWPYGTVENRMSEEQQRRRVVQSAPVSAALEPRMVHCEERRLVSAPVRLVALPSRTPWRSSSLPGCQMKDNQIDGIKPNLYDNKIDQFTLREPTTPNTFMNMNAPTNLSRYSEDSLYVNNPTNMTSTFSRYTQNGDDGNRLYGGKFPIVLPEQPRSRYMNFANCEWIR